MDALAILGLEPEGHALAGPSRRAELAVTVGPHDGPRRRRCERALQAPEIAQRLVGEPCLELALQAQQLAEGSALLVGGIALHAHVVPDSSHLMRSITYRSISRRKRRSSFSCQIGMPRASTSRARSEYCIASARPCAREPRSRIS